MPADSIVNKSAERYIPVAKPSLGEAEAKAAFDCVKSGWISQGPIVEQFEQAIATAHDRRWGVACNSGTSALCIALDAVGVGPGDLVVVPDLTMVAVPNSVRFRGAIPIFVDSEAETGNPAASEVQRLADAGVRPAAVIVAHLYGVPAAGFLEEVSTVWPQAIIIEDCAEAHYARSGGRLVGSLGHLATFSFFSNKIIAAGEGGMVIGDDRLWETRARSLRSHAFDPAEHFNHKHVAYGLRMCDLTAAVGLVQHGRRDELVRSRLVAIEAYRRRIGHHCQCWPLMPAIDCIGHAPWVFTVVCGNEKARGMVRDQLARDGIETRNFFKPMHEQRELRQFQRPGDAFPVAIDLSRRGFYLPLWADMTKEDVEYVCSSIERTFR